MLAPCRSCGVDLDGLGWTACLRCLYAGSECPPEIPRIELEAEIARGGMGVVHRGRHRLGRHVAVKVIHDELADEPAMRARFAREARLLARLSHPGIVTIHDWGDEPQHYIVMELVDGAPIRRCEPARAYELVGELCDAVAAAHAAGIVHRDIKPSNVLVGRTGVKLIDFGIAAPVETAEPLTRTGQQLGTPEYMAPEARAGGSVPADPALDVYAIARLLRTVTAGARLARPIERVVARALADDPRARPALAELRDALRARSTTRRAGLAIAACAASVLATQLAWPSSHAAVPVAIEPPASGPIVTIEPVAPIEALESIEPRESAVTMTPRPSGRPAIARRARRPPPPDEPTAPAILALRVAPWAMVSIDGGTPRRIEPPIERIAIAPGRHVIELANPASGRSERRVVELAAGEVSPLVVDLLAGARLAGAR